MDHVLSNCIRLFSSLYLEYSSLVNVDDSSCVTLIQYGCTDNGFDLNGYGQVNDANGDEITAINYNPNANIDDGSYVPVTQVVQIPYISRILVMESIGIFYF